MRFKRILTATAALAPLVALTAACEDPAKAGPASTPPAATAGAPAPSAPGATGPAPASLAEAQAYLQKFTSCERLGTGPDDTRLPATDDTKDGDWAVTGRGACTDVKRHGDIIIYLVSDMKTFQQAYYDHTQKEMRGGNGSFGVFSRVIVGKGFVAVPTKTRTAVDLVNSDLRILTCNPGFAVPAGYKSEKPWSTTACSPTSSTARTVRAARTWRSRTTPPPRGPRSPASRPPEVWDWRAPAASPS